MKENFRVFILITSGMLFMLAIDKILNFLYAILYGVAFMLILGAYLNITSDRISNKKLFSLLFVGILLLCVAVLLSIQETSAAILLSITLSLSIGGTFCFLLRNMKD